jgi:hypothetical protein
VIRSVILALLLAAVPIQAMAAKPTPVGVVSIRLADASASPHDDPLARSAIVNSVGPGGTVHRQVEVINGTGSSQQVVVYSAGAAVSEGKFAFLPGREANDLVGWVTLDHDVLALTPRTTAMVNVTIHVPPDATPGERYGVVWTEVSVNPAGGGITMVNRVGVRMYLTVGPGGPPAAGFEVSAPVAGRNGSGSPTISVQVRNTGGRTLDIGGTVDLSGGPGGIRAGPFPIHLRESIAPRGAETATVAFDKRLPDGPWDVRIDLRSGLTAAVAHAIVRFPPVAEAPLVPAVRVMVAAGSALLAAIALLLLVRRRRARARSRA